MPAAACQRRAQPHLAALLRRSILSRRRHPRCRRPFSTFSDTDVIPTHQINLFHNHVAHLFHSLLPTAASDDDPLPLSLSWLRRLLDGFLSCLHHFEPLLIAIAGSTSDDRFVSDVLHLAVKVLDVCNVVSTASDSLIDLRRRVTIASSALSLGQLRRARRALVSADTIARRGKQSWSAAMQLNAMAAGLAAPSWDEADAGNAVEMAMHGMATVVVFFMWVLVVAIVPGGAERPVQLPKPPPELQWAGAAAAVQERIEEEWRRIEKAGGGGGRVGMMVELRKIQRCAAAASAAAMPEPAAAAAVAVEVEEVCRVLEEELDSFQNRVRDVFHGIVRCRTTVVDRFAVAVRQR